MLPSTQIAGQSSDGAIAPQVALSCDLAPHLARIMATIGPSAENVALIGHEHAGVPNGIAALRGRRIRQILADRLPVQPQSTGDGGLVHALVGYALDGSEALLRLALDAFPR